MTGPVFEAGAEAAELFALIHALAFADRPERAWSAQEIEATLSLPGARGFLAPACAPCAFLLVQLGADDAEILTLGVAAPHRRRGLAAGLVRAAAIWAASRGAQRFVLEVAEDNDGAQHFYRQAGFERVGLRPGYYRRPHAAVDALILAAPLPLPAGHHSGAGA